MKKSEFIQDVFLNLYPLILDSIHDFGNQEEEKVVEDIDESDIMEHIDIAFRKAAEAANRASIYLDTTSENPNEFWD